MDLKISTLEKRISTLEKRLTVIGVEQHSLARERAILTRALTLARLGASEIEVQAILERATTIA